MPKRAQLIFMAVSPYAIDLPQPAVRYRGFVLIPQPDFSWIVRPERSPMAMLPFRAPASSVADVKALLDWRLSGGGSRRLLGGSQLPIPLVDELGLRRHQL